MSGLSGPGFVHSGGLVRISGREAGFPVDGRMSGLGAGCPVVVGSSVEAGRVDLQGSDVRGPGRMSGAWRLFLPSSIGSLLP